LYVAPGAIICSARYDEKYPGGNHPYKFPCLDEKHLQMAGTSMSTPMIAGAVALIKQAHPNWTPGEIKRALENTAKNLGEDVDAQGYGRIDIGEAVKLQHIPPLAKIETFGHIEETIDLIGTAKGEDFDYYELFYSKKELDEWILICNGDEQVDNKVLCSNFDPKELDNGDYYFKLEVYDIFGQQNEYLSPFMVYFEDVVIKKPTNNSNYKVGELINIIGTIKLGRMAFYKVEFKKKEDSSWTSIKIKYGDERIDNGVLATWNTSQLNEGFYDLKLSVFIRYRPTPIYESYAENMFLSNIRPQSKIVNNGDEDVSGKLTFKVQKTEDGSVWIDVSGETYVFEKTIPANGLIKLDKIFNPLGVSLEGGGDYRIHASFETNGQTIVDSGEFMVR